jgi:co-chaperonin GroES (HSP10)
MDVEMTNDNVLVRPEGVEVSKGGIIMPDSAEKKDRPTKGVVIKCGPGVERDGKWEKMPYSVGMRVLMHQYPSLMLDDPEKPGKVLYVISQRQIVGVLTDKAVKNG